MSRETAAAAHANGWTGDERGGAGVALRAPDGAYLFLMRSPLGDHPGEWCFPGGGIEDGETPQAAALRELKEEAGTHADSLNEPMGEPINGFTTYTLAVPGRFVPELNEEHDGYAWALPENAPHPLHPGVQELFDREQVFAQKHAMDALALDEASVREYDDAGRLHVKQAHISKACVNGYRGSEIPRSEELGLDQNKVYQLLRHPDELAAAADTANGIQVMIRHTPVSAEDHKPDEVVGALGTNAKWNAPYLDNELVIWPQHAVNAVESGEQRELSMGYAYRADMTPGKWEGQAYDGVMRDIKFNHCAIVKKGRAGPDVMVGDSALEDQHKETGMVTITRTGPLSRTAVQVYAALAMHMAPKMAMDSKLDLTPILKDVTAKNLKGSAAKIWQGAMDLGMPMLTPEAKAGGGFGPDDVIMKVLDMVGGQVAAEAPEMDAAPVMSGGEAAVPDAGAAEGGEGGGGGGDIMALLATMLQPEQLAQVKAAMGGGGGGEADPAAASGGEEEETDEEKAAKLAAAGKDGTMPKPMIDKAAMDSALEAHGKAVEARVRKSQREIQDAINFVRPWAGDVPMAYDTAEEVFRAVLGGMDIDVKGVHPDALKPILAAQPKPGENVSREPAHMAMDSAAEDSLAKRFPHAARIRTL